MLTTVTGYNQHIGNLETARRHESRTEAARRRNRAKGDAGAGADADAKGAVAERSVAGGRQSGTDCPTTQRHQRPAPSSQSAPSLS